jgi:hypothetical protein
MSTNLSSKQMETKLYDLVSCLADNYGFDADEAFEYVRWETDVDHVGGIISATEKPAKAPKEAEKPTAAAAGGEDEKIATCRKNIDTWTKKLSSAKDADKQKEKIEKEQKKLEKLLAKAPKVEEKKPEPKKAEPEKAEKRIKRFSPVMAGQLKTALEGVKLEMTDKLKKEFQQYVEELTDDDYRKEGLAEHMRAFAKLKAPAEEPEVEEAEDEETAEEAEESEAEEKIVGDSTVVDVTLKELQSIGMTATVEPPGTFWDADKGRFVKGPEADDDEDFEEKKFEGTTYVVGEKTGRVYEARDSGDVFAGFIGVGKFKKMTK